MLRLAAHSFLSPGQGERWLAKQAGEGVVHDRRDRPPDGKANSLGRPAAFVGPPRGIAAMTQIRGIIFDKDGTLVDFEATWTEVAEKLALVASGGDPAEAARLLDLGGFDAATRSFRSDW